LEFDYIIPRIEHQFFTEIARLIYIYSAVIEGDGRDVLGDALDVDVALRDSLAVNRELDGYLRPFNDLLGLKDAVTCDEKHENAYD
jgi:hypothetical protein